MPTFMAAQNLLPKHILIFDLGNYLEFSDTDIIIN